jgi:hypothetical protein
MGSGAFGFVSQVLVVVGGSVSRKKRDELIYFIDRIMDSSVI